MSRPDAALLHPDRYPHRVTIPTRFNDLDLNRHVNNVAMISLVEEARARLWADCGMTLSQDERGLVIASFAMEFVGECFYPLDVDAFTGVAAQGRTSVTLEQMLAQKGRPVAYARSVVVHRKRGLPHPPEPELFEAIGRWKIRG